MQLPPTTFVLLDYAKASPPKLLFPETPPGQSLEDVLALFRTGAWLGQPVRVFLFENESFFDVSLHIAKLLQLDPDPDATTKDFIERHIPPSFAQIIGEDLED